jgi:lactam utilization protein B
MQEILLSWLARLNYASNITSRSERILDYQIYKMSPEELTAMVVYQVGALKGFLDAEGVTLNHVKPHGVLYGMMYRDREVCRAVYSGVPKGTPVFGLAGTLHEEVAKELGLPFVAELYGDVKYSKDGTLVIDRKKK